MLATNAGLLTPILGDPSPWTPRRLYLNGEAGAWYDPGDLTAEKVAWRRNLYLYSEPASATGYTAATNVTFGTIAQFGFLPSGGSGVTLLDATVNRELRQTFALTAGVTYTLSFYVYVGAGVLPNQGSGNYRDFTITRDNADVTNYALISYEAIGGGVYRATHSWTHTGTGASVSVRKYSGLNTATRVDFSGLQLEVGTVASAYQRITDFTSDFLAAFPTHALYQDAAGTTPVTVLGQPVGLALDKSRGALTNIGPELITNGDFSGGTTGWSTGTGWSISSGRANCSNTSATGLIQNAVFVSGKTYRVTFEFNRTAGSLAFWIAGSQLVQSGINTSGTKTFHVSATTSGSLFLESSSGTNDFWVDNVSVREVPGVHAIQATSASRPALDARVNLLTYSEQFDNAAWQKANVSVSANTSTAPDGTSTADTVTASAALSYIYAGITLSAASYVWSFYAKAGTVNTVRLDAVTAGFAAGASCTFTLTGSGTAGAITHYGASSGFVAAIADAGNGWYRCSLAGMATAATWYHELMIANAASSILLWGADLRLATDAAYPYQRVVTATDYADVGVPRSFLHDGFDDSSYTASSLDLSGTDKVTVWAGVYKNSDAAFGVLAELTANAGSNNGGLAVIAPGNSPTRYQWVSRGTAAASAVTSSASFSAPHSAVFSGVGDIAADVCALRINGAQVATDSTDQGTGNYANAVLYMGRRNNTSNPLNGKVYCIIIRGGVTDAATLALTERYVGSRMGIVL